MRRIGWPVGIGVLLALLAAGEAVGAEGGGQPDVFGWHLDLAIWTVVVFLLLLFILKKFAWIPMLEGLHKREENIHAAVAEAEKAKAEASQLRLDIASERQKMADQIREAFDEARRDAQRLKDEMAAQAKAEIQAERDRLYKELNTAKDQALSEMWRQSAELATLISSKALRRQLSIDDHRALVEEALTELGPSIAERRHVVRG